MTPPDDGAETRLHDGPLPIRERASRLDAGDAFGLRYRIIRELGAGGMGVVYQAWDEVLAVAVALKVVRRHPSAKAADMAAIERRFKRELLLARQVTHKNVVRIHDLGEVEDTKYITMTYVDGEDLATTLKREGRLPVPQALAIARQIASGLQAVHEAGVVHRDLKPANIMLDRDGHALLMDFGIAQAQGAIRTRGDATPSSASDSPAAAATIEAIQAADDATILSAPEPDGDGATVGGGETTMGDGQTVLTPPIPASATITADSVSLGAIVGTIDYMSPEQSRGQPVDQRTDIYAFGMIVRDMLIGLRTRPEGMTPWDALMARLAEPPTPVSAERDDVPAALDAVITRCRALDPADRFATTADLVAAFDRLDEHGHLIPEPRTRRMGPLGWSLAAAGVAGLMAGTWWLAQRGAPVVHEPMSVLVADFANTADPVYSGIVEQALTVGVEGASFITAFPRRDAVRVANEIKAGGKINDETARLVAMREGVPVLIGGTITPRGAGVTIGVKAVSATDQKVLLDWSTNAANKDEVLAAVGRAADRVRRTLGDRPAGDSGAQETFTAASLDAAKAYAEAQEFFYAGKYDDAIAAYQRTVSLDTDFGRAWAGLAASFANRGRTEEADASYKKAFGLLDRMTEREKLRTRTGYYLFTRDYERAADEARTLLAKFPGDTSAMANLALAQFYRRDMKAALDMGRKASDAYPNNIVRKNNAALFAMYAGDFDEAVRLGNGVLTLNPAFEKAFIAIGVSQLAAGREADAAATFGRLRALGTPSAKNFAATADADRLLALGKTAEALAAIDAAIALNRESKDMAWLGRRLALRASVYAALGRKADAIRDAREAVTLGKEEGILYTAGRALIDSGQSALALELAADLDDRLENDPRLYGALLRGEAALAAGRARAAVNAFKDALKLGEAWMAHLSLGRAYLALNAFPEASAELDRCVSRRGEATAVFLDDRPTWHLYLGVPELLTKAREGLAAGR